MKRFTEITQESNWKIAASTPGAREPRERARSSYNAAPESGHNEDAPGSVRKKEAGPRCLGNLPL